MILTIEPNYFWKIFLMHIPIVFIINSNFSTTQKNHLQHENKLCF